MVWNLLNKLSLGVDVIMYGGVGHPGRCILHPLVFRVLPR
jgi:hypothetical protein